MKTTIKEHDGDFEILIEPDSVLEASQIIRMGRSSFKKLQTLGVDVYNPEYAASHDSAPIVLTMELRRNNAVKSRLGRWSLDR